ncbi:MAG: stage V sporulation protein T [Firmicutes bacterium]|nr:stage V sporulation protein T [Bacillota bacterium]
MACIFLFKEDFNVKATGIVRRIDDLGRIVIPKEIRRTLRIRESDPLEIFTDKEGEIILKKYSPIGELGTFAKEYADSLAKSAGHITCIVDKDQIIAVSGGAKKEFMEKHISANLENMINTRNTHISNRSESDFVPILEDDDETIYNHELITPIISEGDVLGAIIMLSVDKKMGEVEGKLAQTAAGFLGKQLEQ